MKIQIWDLPTRIFHWVLVVCFVFLVFSGETGNLFEWHSTAGIIVLSLVLYRLIWGFIGSTTSRFSDFLYSPRQIIAYAKTLFSHQTVHHAGHNPVGGVMVLVMLALLLFQGGTGLFSTDEVLVEGPLYGLVSETTAELMSDLHHSSAELMIPLVILHVLAIVFYRIYKKHDLVKPMLTGKTDFPEAMNKPLRFTSAIYGMILMLVCCLLLYFGLPWLGSLGL